ncbi:hypothetical protein [Streptomyces sp. NPDC003697]
MRRTMPILLLVLVVSACTSHNDEGKARPTSSSSTSTDTPAPHPSPGDPLALPSQPDFLLPVTQGNSDKSLPAFTPAGNVYTIHGRCTGKGSVTIQYGSKDDDQSKITCGTPITVGRVYIDPGTPQHLSVKLHGSGISWTVAVLDGTHAM